MHYRHSLVLFLKRLFVVLRVNIDDFLRLIAYVIGFLS